MRKEQIVLNNLVFMNDHEQGMQQLDMLKKAVSFGVSSVELRREYFDDIVKETSAIAEFAADHKLRLFYSVPDEVFVNHRLNPKLTQYYDEAQALGIYAIKFNIGDFEMLSSEEVSALNQLLKRGIQTNIENDQTQVSGKINDIEKFMSVVTENHLDIRYVYDMGNWRYVGEDEVVAAEKLRQYVRYIHVKDAQGQGDNLATVPLNVGDISWQSILNILPSNVPVAVEYPTVNDTVIQDGVQALAMFN
ncbi:TIM barrel protein [Leuconostoc koreense]|nr:TIM barrel protein [Leuconostoc mesenteroides]QGM25349.1 TIM barrel protein [Leuconostoc mesenteroides subsp. mesenteroides]